jgi:cadmium resistance protein CadD (predicted permease)
VSHLIVTVSTAAAVFASTNIDDLVVLTFLFLASRAAGRPRRWQVVAGQCVGVAVLVASAAVAALGMVIVPTRWAGLLGLVPLGIGLWKLIGAMRRSPDGGSSSSVAAGLTGVTGVAIVNGADNLAVYAPLFHSLDSAGMVVTLAVFVAMIGVWCAAAAWLGAHLAAVDAIRRLGHLLTPIVFIAIGVLLLARSVIQ